MTQYEIIHSLPGRLRIKIKGLKGNRNYARALEKTFNNDWNLDKFKANYLTGKALIIYNPQSISGNQLLNKIGDTINLLINKITPKTFSRQSKHEINKPINNIFEPEDLPIQTQFIQVVGSGLLLAIILIKRVFWGRSSIGASSKVNGLAAATTIITGYPILRSGLENLLKRRKLNNDFLISAATLVSLFLKESITGLVVIWLVNLSTLFQTLTLDKSRKAIKEMLQGRDETAWLEVDGSLISVPIESLEVGNIIAVHVGEKIQVDGEVVNGEAAVSQSIITGESIPITKRVGDKVFAGSIVELGSIRIKAEKVGQDTSLARIVHMVEEASEVRAPIENLADRYSDKIVPISFGLAGLIYLLTGDFRRSMTMLIVACPCAAGLSTPTAISAAIGNSAKKGILIKGGSYLERIGKTQVVLFDKTGTLTEGKPEVRQIITTLNGLSTEEIVQLAASLEAQTNHPLAKALLQYAENIQVSLLDVKDKEIMISLGVKGKINDELILVGNEELMVEYNVNISRSKAKANKLHLLGQTVLYVAKDKVLLGLIGIADKIRDESPRAIKELRREGIDNIGLITGDCNEMGELVGKELGLDKVWARALPEDKVGIVQQFQKEGLVVTMIGEGINDSPALAKADIGIAMGTGGTDVAIESADVVLAGDNPLKVPSLIRLSNHTMEIIKQNFAFAVGINAIGLMLGAAKFISPLTAAILHNLSTFGVVINSSRLLNYQQEKKGRKRVDRRPRIRG